MSNSLTKKFLRQAMVATSLLASGQAFASGSTESSLTQGATNNLSCITASEIVGGIPDKYLNEKQKDLKHIVSTVSQTQLGMILAENNADNDILYCSGQPNIEGARAGYNHEAKTITVEPDLTNTQKITAMAEEMAHAYQFSNNPILKSAANNTQFEHFDRYMSFMGLEAQAKIWAGVIVHKLNIGITDDKTVQTAQTCMQNLAKTKSCFKSVFTDFLSRDNDYTTHYYNQFGNNPAFDKDDKRHNIPPVIYNEFFGGFPEKYTSMHFLDQNFAYTDTPNLAKNGILSQYYMAKLAQKDGDIKSINRNDKRLPHHKPGKDFNPV